MGNDEFSLNRFCHFPSQFLIDLPSISMEVKFVIIIRPHAGIIMKGDVVKSDFDKKESRLWSFNAHSKMPKNVIHGCSLIRKTSS